MIDQPVAADVCFLHLVASSIREGARERSVLYQNCVPTQVRSSLHTVTPRLWRTIGMAETASLDLNKDFVWQRVVQLNLLELEVGIDSV